MQEKAKWTISDALKCYHVENWGDSYFGINAQGNMVVFPQGKSQHGIDLKVVVDEVKRQGLQFPVLFRFQDMIRHRVIALNEAFRQSIIEYGYQGRYQGVYPIKVNQLREVVEEILDAGRPYDFGLEAGSKAELAAVIAMSTPRAALIICNGYKDYTFIKTALLGMKMGKRVIIVVEKLTELFQIIAVSKELNLRPEIGIRSKLYARGSGRWESSSGEGAKFGLTTPEILQAITFLKSEGLDDCFKLLHFHIGSQITDIRPVKDAVKEATRFYAKIQKMGLSLEFLDVGGGLAVDYDGSRTSFESSMNYSLSEYVADIVYSIQEVCRSEGVKEPHIVSESGRALVAQHSALMVDVFGTIEKGGSSAVLPESSQESSVVKELRYLSQNISPDKLSEHLHDAVQRKEEGISLFNLGFLSLEDRARVEQLFWCICKKIQNEARGLNYVSDEIDALTKKLAQQYLCNFSVFQSVPDHWAIQHLFPIVPLHRHLEKPIQDATLVDITCDSDGKINKFIDLKAVKDTLSLHPLLANEPYYLGLFLMGAYQDIMGDVHNLFGRVNEVHLFLDDSEPSGYYIEEVIPGQTIGGILSTIQYNQTDLEKKVKDQLDVQVRAGLLKPRESVELNKFYESVLAAYTYVV